MSSKRHRRSHGRRQIRQWRRYLPELETKEVTYYPVSDGGEGVGVTYNISRETYIRQLYIRTNLEYVRWKFTIFDLSLNPGEFIFNVISGGFQNMMEAEHMMYLRMEIHDSHVRYNLNIITLNYCKMSKILKLEGYKLLSYFALLPFLSMSEKFGIFFKIVFIFSILFWLFSITTSGYKKFNFKNKRVFVFFYVNIIFLLLWGIVFSFFYSELVIQKYLFNSSPDPLVLVFNFYSWVSYLFTFYLASRVLCSNEEGKLAGFRKSYLYFLGFIFLPIGIWFIQPKARLLVE